MLRRDVPPKVFPAPVFIRVLRDANLPFAQLSTTEAVASLPGARVTIVGTPSGPDGWQEVTAQLDVWADDEITAGDLAAAVATYWDSLLYGRVAVAVDDEAYVSQAWVEQDPAAFTVNDEAPRYQLTVGLRIHPQEN